MNIKVQAQENEKNQNAMYIPKFLTTYPKTVASIKPAIHEAVNTTQEPLLRTFVVNISPTKQFGIIPNPEKKMTS